MTQKEILELLTKNGIVYVVIGGVALRLHNSPRVTNDIDSAGIKAKPMNRTSGF